MFIVEELFLSLLQGYKRFYEKQFLDKGSKIHYLEYKIHGEHPFIEPEEFNNTEAIKYK